MTDRPGLDFSFSGLKTQVLLAWRDSDQSDATRADIARGFEDAVVDTLAIKCERALDAAGCDTLVVAGGVGANKRLRAKLAEHRGAARRPRLFPAPGAVHRQRRDDRLRRRAAPGGRAARDAAGHVQPRWDMASLPRWRFPSPRRRMTRSMPWTKSSSKASRSRR